MKNISRVAFIGFCCFVFLVGCQSNPSIGEPGQLRSEKSYRDGQEFEFGIAMSGGGLRAASYSYGVLKQLYDDELLQDVDIISSVSGGGYTAYALFLSEHLQSIKNETSSQTEFGSTLFSPSNFNVDLYRHYYTSNFVTYGKLLKTLVTSDTPASVYKTAILRKYGFNEGTEYLKFSDLKLKTQDGKIPYLVVNTTLLKSSGPNKSKPNSDIFEFTPFGSGNNQFGYLPYENGAALDLIDGITISGAAEKKTLKKDVIDPTTGSNQIFTLSDGGHSENLGAFSLIERGVKKIIIIDAELDPNYTFGAYTKLTDRFKKGGVVINEIDKIIDMDDPDSRKLRTSFVDGSAESSVFVGAARNANGICSEIYYVKMANSKEVNKLLSAKLVDEGKEQIEHIRVKLKLEDKIRNNSNSSVLSQYPINHDAIFAYHVENYPKVLASLWKPRFINMLKLNFSKLNFPQYSTADQSFYNDQFLAFVGLGYFTAKEIMKKIATQDNLCKEAN